MLWMEVNLVGSSQPSPQALAPPSLSEAVCLQTEFWSEDLVVGPYHESHPNPLQ